MKLNDACKKIDTSELRHLALVETHMRDLSVPSLEWVIQFAHSKLGKRIPVENETNEAERETVPKIYDPQSGTWVKDPYL